MKKKQKLFNEKTIVIFLQYYYWLTNKQIKFQLFDLVVYDNLVHYIYINLEKLKVVYI